MNVVQRALAPTPSFFKKLRVIGLILTAISGALLGAQTPEILQDVATHIATAGTVIMAVSQVTVDNRACDENPLEDD